MKGIKFSLIDYVWMVHVVYIFLYGSDKVKSADMLSYDFRSHICDENMRCRNVLQEKVRMYVSENSYSLTIMQLK